MPAAFEPVDASRSRSVLRGSGLRPSRALDASLPDPSSRLAGAVSGPASRRGTAARAALALGGAAVVLAGCTSAEVDRCGGGGELVLTNDGDYCVYAVAAGSPRAGVVCPADRPARLELTAAVVCAAEPREAGELPDDVCAIAGRGCGPRFAGPPVTWSPIAAETGPNARWGMSAVHDPSRRRVLAFGGFDGELLHDDLWELSLDTLRWQPIPTTNGPSPREFAASVLDAERDRMLLVGGYIPSESSFDEVWALDLQTATWSALPPLPAPSDSAAIATDGRRIWMFGGDPGAGTLTDALLELDRATDRWRPVERRSVWPPPRIFPAMAHRDGALWMVGGRQAAEPVIFSDLWRFDLATGTWEQIPSDVVDLPGAVTGYALDDDCAALLLVGGESPFDVAHAQVSAIRLGDTPSVASLPGLPRARAHAAVALDPVERRLVVVGGRENVTVGPVSEPVTLLGQLGACP